MPGRATASSIHGRFVQPRTAGPPTLDEIVAVMRHTGDDAVARAVNQLQRGRPLVLVELREIPAGEARDQFERLARAA